MSGAPSLPTPEELASLSPEFLAEENNFQLRVVASIFLVLQAVMFFMFILSRVCYAERNTWDIWVLYPISYLCCLGLAICALCMITIGGRGRHIDYWFLHEPSRITTSLKIEAAGEFLYLAGIMLPKIPILLLYVRVFTDRITRIVSWIVIGCIVASWVSVAMVVYFVICTPFAFKWDKTIPNGHCGDIMSVYKYVSVPNIVTDLTILILPLPSLVRLQTSRAKKVGIMLTFLTGGLGIVVSIIRFVGFYTTDLMSDVTYHSTNTWMYTLMEPSTYFICSCFLGIRPLLTAIYEKSGRLSFIGKFRESNHLSFSKGSHELETIRHSNGRLFAPKVVTKVPKHLIDDNERGLIGLNTTAEMDSTFTGKL